MLNFDSWSNNATQEISRLKEANEALRSELRSLATALDQSKVSNSPPQHKATEYGRDRIDNAVSADRDSLIQEVEHHT